MKPLPKPKRGALFKEKEAEKKDKAMEDEEEGSKMYEEQNEPEGNRDKELYDEGYYAEGGYVASGKNRNDFESGINKAPRWQPDKNKSEAGTAVRAAKTSHTPEEKEFQTDMAKESHKNILHEMKSMKKPNLYGQGGYIVNPTEAQARSGYAVHKAEGGDVEPDMDGDSPEDMELMEAVSSELMDAFEAKDKKGILDAIRAIVLSCK